MFSLNIKLVLIVFDSMFDETSLNIKWIFFNFNFILFLIKSKYLQPFLAFLVESFVVCP